jgi:hydroxymethylglutaryl-CoA lyase
MGKAWAEKRAMGSIELLEVSPRDGLQNEPDIVSTENKLALIDAAIQAGFRRIEVASFVNPQKVPQMADAGAVMAGLPGRPDVTFIALALNQRGFDRAAEAGAREVNFVLAASEAFAGRNSGASVAGLIAALNEVVQAAAPAGIRVSATISTAFGCPFEGEVAPAKVLDIVAAAADAGATEIALADTIGVADPGGVRALFEAAHARAPGVRLRAHFHNTRNTAVANAYAAWLAGVRVFDGSLAGIGGCPFAPGAAGNVASEDLAYMFARMGVETGIGLPGAIAAAKFVGVILGRKTPGMVSRAGGFPAASG